MCQVFEEGSILVRDKGIGIPVERKKKKHKCSQVEIVESSLHSLIKLEPKV